MALFVQYLPASEPAPGHRLRWRQNSRIDLRVTDARSWRVCMITPSRQRPGRLPLAARIIFARSPPCSVLWFWLRARAGQPETAKKKFEVPAERRVRHAQAIFRPGRWELALFGRCGGGREDRSRERRNQPARRIGFVCWPAPTSK